MSSSKIDCIYPTVCLPCMANYRVSEIIEKAAGENRAPTDAELEEAQLFLKAMMDDIEERAIRRQNIIDSVLLGVI